MRVGSGVSPMAIPGTAGCQYTADGLEHRERGLPSSQVADHRAQLDKRRDNLLEYDYGSHWAEVEGDGPLALITWGSSTGPLREALARLEEHGEGGRHRLVVPRLLAPAQPDAMAAALAGAERALVIEQSHSAQFFHYLVGYWELPCPVASWHRPGPLPLRPGELVQAITQWSVS